MAFRYGYRGFCWELCIYAVGHHWISMQEATLPDWASSCFQLGRRKRVRQNWTSDPKDPFKKPTNILKESDSAYLTMALVPALSSALQGHCLHSLQRVIISRFSWSRNRCNRLSWPWLPSSLQPGAMSQGGPPVVYQFCQSSVVQSRVIGWKVPRHGRPYNP